MTGRGARGLLVAVLRTGRRKVHAINPMAAARYRHSVTRKKSCAGDALVLANILRTDMHAHRTLPDDTDLAHGIVVQARAQQDATWNRQTIATSSARCCASTTPVALAAVEPWKNALCRLAASALLKAASTPTPAAG
ncbi:IS110 family transposase IS117 [Streptomyces sp. RB17]|uniref:IS110 family transposase n=1 Tax=Streptomyces sp. RB17 TaxID=2585197 RepID=UPI001297E0C9|nr:transposase [Streptomyces sp. RB17]MQY39894.1 IS110 family transposase IS117 [Streptomyces sp. RB17]